VSPELLQYATLGLLALLVVGVFTLALALLLRRLAPPAATLTLPTGAESFAPVVNVFQSQINEMRAVVERQAAAAEARREQEDQTQKEIRQIARVMLGSSTSGRSGERVLREALKELPAQWLIEQYAVNGKEVEFAIRLPDGMILPIDSKVVAQSHLDKLDAAATEQERASRAKEVRDEIIKRSKEVTKYVDGRTLSFAIMAIPDGVYQVAGSTFGDAFLKNHALILPYSLVLPFILLTVEQHNRAPISADDVRATYLLTQAVAHLAKASDTLESHMGDAITRMRNGAETMKNELNAARLALSQAQDAATASSASDGKVRVPA
jgi:DNA recombination protein RmuC